MRELLPHRRQRANAARFRHVSDRAPDSGSPPLGMFAAEPRPPAEPDIAQARALEESLSSDPGLRMAKATGRRVYFAGELTPQRFVEPPSQVNDADQVRAAVRSMNQRRSLGKTRGSSRDAR